ncbi:MAG: hypothetical protein QM800_12730 [Paludibacter sp.]
MAKKSKFDFKKIAINTVTAGATGAVANVISEAMASTDQDIVDAAFIVGGALLPQLVKNDMVETAGHSLIAVGAYRLAERNDLAGKLGITNAPAATTTGLKDIRAIGSSDWKPDYRPGKNVASKPAGKASNVQ